MSKKIKRVVLEEWNEHKMNQQDRRRTLLSYCRRAGEPKESKYSGAQYFQVTGICTTGTQAISQADGLNDGIVICSYKLADMIYTELHEDLAWSGVSRYLMASQNLISECCLWHCAFHALKVQDLINTVNLMVEVWSAVEENGVCSRRTRNAADEKSNRDAMEF